MLYELSPFIAGLICFFMVYRFSFFNIQGFSRMFIFFLFLCKAIAGVLVAHFSMQVLTGTDGYFYFESAKALHSYALQNPLNYIRLFLGLHGQSLQNDYFHLLNWKNLPPFNDGETMIKLNSLLHFISFNNYYTHTIYFSFFSFCGLTGVYKVVAKISQTQNKILLSVLVLFPSMLLFTSGNLKETLLTGSFGLFLYHLYYSQFSKKYIALAILFGLLLFFIKPHFILLFIPVAIAFALCNLFIKQKALHFLIYILVIILYFTSASLLTQARSGQSISATIALTQQSAMKNAVFKRAGSYSRPPIISADIISFIKNIPSAFFHALRHPSVSVNKTTAINLAGVENIITRILVLVALAVCFKKDNLFYKYHIAILFFTFLFYTLIGFTQSLEALILRFKAPVLPLLISGLYLFIIQIRKQKVI